MKKVKIYRVLGWILFVFGFFGYFADLLQQLLEGKYQEYTFITFAFGRLLGFVINPLLWAGLILLWQADKNEYPDKKSKWSIIIIFYGILSLIVIIAAMTYPIVASLISNHSHTSTNPVLEQIFQDNLWISEYPALIKAAEQANDNTLSTSYMTGPNLTSKVELYLSKKADNGLVLKTTLPQKATFSVDPKIGEKRPSEAPTVIIIRDHDLDGLPDDFHMEPSRTPLYKEQFSADGFIKYRDSPEHQVILLQWIIGIKYATNYFLHGVRWSIPR